MTVPTPPSRAVKVAPTAETAPAADTTTEAEASAGTATSTLGSGLIPRPPTAVLPPVRMPDPGPIGDDAPDAGEPAFSEESPRRGRPDRLAIGWHTLSAEPLAEPAIAPSLLPPPCHGLILGRDAAGPVTVTVFSPDPLRLTLVGDRRLARILLLRALALGAAAVVVTTDPTAWQGFGRNATGEADRVVVLPEHRPVAAFGSPEQPALIVYDLRDSGPADPPQPGPWQTQLTVLHALTEAARPHTEDSRMVLVQNPDDPDMLTLVHDGATRRVHICPTPTEQRAFGPVTSAGTTPTASAAPPLAG